MDLVLPLVIVLQGGTVPGVPTWPSQPPQPTRPTSPTAPVPWLITPGGSAGPVPTARREPLTLSTVTLESTACSLDSPLQRETVMLVTTAMPAVLALTPQEMCVQQGTTARRAQAPQHPAQQAPCQIQGEIPTPATVSSVHQVDEI